MTGQAQEGGDVRSPYAGYAVPPVGGLRRCFHGGLEQPRRSCVVAGLLSTLTSLTTHPNQWVRNSGKGSAAVLLPLTFRVPGPGDQRLRSYGAIRTVGPCREQVERFDSYDGRWLLSQLTLSQVTGM